MQSIDVVHSEKLGLDFSFHLGIGDKQINQLIEFTQNNADSGIQNNTSDWKGGNGRFSSREEFDKWLKKGRSIYTLTNPETDNLEGIIWFGEEEFPTAGNQFVEGFDPSGYGITYAIRTYGDTRGAGISIPFTKKAMNIFKTSNEFLAINKKGIWLETNTDNTPAISAYKKLGCQQVSTSTSNGRILMVFPK